MASTQSQPMLNGIVRNLVQRGLLNQESAQQAQADASTNETPVVTHLVKNNVLDASTIAKVAGEDFGIPIFDISSFEDSVLPELKVDQKFLVENQVMPLFQRGPRLFVALADPTNLRALDEIKFQTSLTVEPIIVEADKLIERLSKHQKEHDEPITDLLSDDYESGDYFEADGGGKDDEKNADDGIEDSAVVGFVNKVLLTAIRKGASDIHFEPYEKFYRIRYRQDGILQEGESPPISLAERIAARVKVISQLDIAERRVPQDGRIKLKLSKTRAIDFRVNSCPTLFGEKIVLRILDPTSAQLGIDQLGYEPDQKKLLMDAIQRPQGMVLVTGPTGSGKTVSLYTCLNILNTSETNISTAEDPAEINLAGINQVNVNPKVGLTFASALKAFLRQDPDIIMVGEIRDIETGEIAIKAAQTGHLVLSTLHTNDGPQTITRLMNMGVAPFNIATSLNLVVAQRLARRLCKHCKTPAEIPDHSLIEAGFTEKDLKDPDFQVFQAVGCQHCTGGYKGRVGIYQVMPVSEAMGRIIMDGGNAIDIADQAQKEGVRDLRVSGLWKVKQGLTTLEEINRVTTD